MGNAHVNAMAFFVWRQTRFPRYVSRLKPERTGGDVHPRPPCARISGLTKIEAEDLIDWLEATGRRQWKLTYIRGEGFSVSFS